MLMRPETDQHMTVQCRMHISPTSPCAPPSFVCFVSFYTQGLQLLIFTCSVESFNFTISLHCLRGAFFQS